VDELCLQARRLLNDSLALFSATAQYPPRGPTAAETRPPGGTGPVEPPAEAFAENRRRAPHSRAVLGGIRFRLQPRVEIRGWDTQGPIGQANPGQSVFEHGFDGDDGPHAESTLPQQVLRISVPAFSVLPHPAPPRRDHHRNSA
jgi:hypothetical protein